MDDIAEILVGFFCPILDRKKSYIHILYIERRLDYLVCRESGGVLTPTTQKKRLPNISIII